MAVTLYSNVNTYINIANYQYEYLNYSIKKDSLNNAKLLFDIWFKRDAAEFKFQFRYLYYPNCVLRFIIESNYVRFFRCVLTSTECGRHVFSWNRVIRIYFQINETLARQSAPILLILAR